MPKAGLLPLIAIVFCIAVLGEPRDADAASCADYDLRFEFQFKDSKTTGCIGINEAEFAAGAGIAFYGDTYCRSRNDATIRFQRHDDKITLAVFPYKSCENPIWNLTASIALHGVNGGVCFNKLTFDWIGTRVVSYEALPRGQSKDPC